MELESEKLTLYSEKVVDLDQMNHPVIFYYFVSKKGIYFVKNGVKSKIFRI
jgi:hypothetical protein